MSAVGGEARALRLVARGLRVAAFNGPKDRSMRGRFVVDGVDLELGAGRSLGLVGGSGAGKSTLARALVGLERGLAGSLRLCGGREGAGGVELVGAPARAWRGLRAVTQLCWQDPARALDPRLTAGAAIGEARALAGLPRLRGEELAALLEEVRLAEALLGRLPSAMSGGQRQRVALARALAAEPQVLIADEVTSALDRPLAFELVDLLRARVTGGMGLLFVTHDLALLPGLVDRVMVMVEGKVVEEGATAALLAAPQQPATRALWAALPRLEGPRGAVT